MPRPRSAQIPRAPHFRTASRAQRKRRCIGRSLSHRVLSGIACGFGQPRRQRRPLRRPSSPARPVEPLSARCQPAGTSGAQSSCAMQQMTSFINCPSQRSRSCGGLPKASASALQACTQCPQELRTAPLLPSGARAILRGCIPDICACTDARVSHLPVTQRCHGLQRSPLRRPAPLSSRACAPTP